MASVSLLDLAILVLLVGLVLLVALAVKKKSAGGGGDSTTSNSYFLANRSIPWWASACSLFAANIGNEHFGERKSVRGGKPVKGASFQKKSVI